MVAVASRETRIRTEVRGDVARLWDGASGEIVIAGSAGTGKTRGVLEWIHWRCEHQRIRVLMLRKSLESLKASALVTFQEQVLHKFDGRQSLADGVTYFGGNAIRPAQFTYQRTGATIILGGMDNAAKVLSTEYDVIYVNECTELIVGEWEQLSSRTDRPGMDNTRPPSVLIGDCNPDAPSHWILTRARDGALTLWNSTHQDNPAMWDMESRSWTESGIRYIAKLDALTGVRKERLRHGRWVQAEGAIYEFDRARHLIDPFLIPEDWPRYWWIDFGYVNPFVWLWVTEGPDGDLFVYREIYMTHRLVADHAREGLALSANEPAPVAVITDHDAEDRATFERETGVATTAALKDVSPGLQTVQRWMRSEDNRPPRLRFFRDMLVERDESLAERGKPCSTVEEFPGYVWDTRQGRKKGEQPLKVDDHGMDTVRYGVYWREQGLTGRLLF